MSMKSKLATANEAYQQGRQGQTPPPDGDVLLQLVKAEIGESASNGSLFIRREHLICEGELEGTTFSDFLSITKAQGEPSPSAWRIDRWIEEMGYEAMNDISEDLEPILEALNQSQPYYYASVRTSVSNGRSFTNVENCQVVEADQVAKDDADAEAAPQDDAEPNVAEDDDGGYAQLFNIALANGLPGLEDGMEFDALLELCNSVEWPIENFQDDQGNEITEEVEFMKSMGMDILYPKEPAPAPKPAPKTATRPTAAKPAGKPTTVAKPSGKPAPKPAAKPAVKAPAKAPAKPAGKAPAPIRRR